MRLLLSTLAIGALSLALPVMAAQAAPMDGAAHRPVAAQVETADWNGYQGGWHHDDRHEWRGDYEHHWHRHWDRPPPPYGYYAPPPPPPPYGYYAAPQGGYVYGYTYGG
jgi:hypothetical protein